MPVITNPGFEEGLAGWAATGVALESEITHEGERSLALQGGAVSQVVTGLDPGGLYTLSLAYLDDTPEAWILSHARVLLDGEPLGEIHTGQSHEDGIYEYLDAGGFEFIAPAASVTLKIESLSPGPSGLLIDKIRIVPGGLPLPPEHAWDTLEDRTGTDARGGRRLANGGFEEETSDPDEDPNNSGPEGNPHLCGYSLPGWLVTRENVDIIGYGGAAPPEGAQALDTGGHGPGGIAQTVTGLVPGAVYTFSFMYARHASWGEEDMTGEVLANGRRVENLVRGIGRTWEQGYELKEIPVLATAEGKLTLEIRSTTTDQGGNIIYDDIRLKEGGDAFLAWAKHHAVPADAGADTDGDGLSAALEFTFGSDPGVPGGLPVPSAEDGEVRLRVPVSGLALAAGFSHRLWCSRDLLLWREAGDPESGTELLSDSSSPGEDGWKEYGAAAGEARLFWRHEAGPP